MPARLRSAAPLTSCIPSNRGLAAQRQRGARPVVSTGASVTAERRPDVEIIATYYGTFGRYKSDGSWLAAGGVKTGLNVLVVVKNP